MAVLCLHEGEQGTIRKGDVVFHWDPSSTLIPLHVGIYIGDKCAIDQNSIICVSGIPRSRICPVADPDDSEYADPKILGAAHWGEMGEYSPRIIGQNLDIDEVKLKEVVILMYALRTELAALPASQQCACHWSSHLIIDHDRTFAGGLPTFRQGSCSQFVEYIYELAGIDIVQQASTYEPSQPQRLYPATQIHAFWVGEYPFGCEEWHPDLEKYPNCKYGIRSMAK